MDATPTPPELGWKRFPVRLSMRTLMVIVLVLGVSLGRVVIPARVQRDAVEAIRRVGGEVAYDVPWSKPGMITPKRKASGPDWIRKWLGPDFVDTVTYVRLDGERCNDETLRAACQLSSLEELVVTDTGVSDAGAEELGRLKNLRSLDIRLNGITGRSVTSGIWANFAS